MPAGPTLTAEKALDGEACNAGEVGHLLQALGVDEFPDQGQCGPRAPSPRAVTGSATRMECLISSSWTSPWAISSSRLGPCSSGLHDPSRRCVGRTPGAISELNHWAI